jgi:hypothetical protein
MTGLRRRLAGAVVALVVAASPLVSALLPGVVPGGPTSAAAASSPSTSTDAVTVQITSITPAVLHPGEDLAVTATLINRTSDTLDNVVADLRLNRFRPGSRAELDAWVTGSNGAIGSRVASASPVSLPPGGSASVQLTLAAEDVGLLDLPGTWGPRGLAVEALDSGGAQLGIQRTFALWMRDEVVPQVRVAVLAPVTGASTDPAQLERSTGPGGQLNALGDLIASEPDVEAAVDPALVAAASQVGPDATAWATELTAALARRDTFALPWADTDLGAVAHASSTELLSAAMNLSATSGLPGVNARTDVVWAPDGTLDGRTADTAAAAGAHAIVVSPATLQADQGATPALADLSTPHGSISALVPDSVLTDLFVAPNDVQPGATTATTVQRMLAEIAVLAHDDTRQQRDVLIAPGRDWTPDASLVSTLLGALQTSPWSRLTSVNALLGTQDEGASHASLPSTVIDAGELAPADVQALSAARDATLSFAHAIGDTGTLTADLDQQVLAPLSVAWRSNVAGRQDLVQKVLAGTTTTRDGLSLTGPPSLNVISASAPVRFVVHNKLTVPATVAVSVEPHKACLRPVRSGQVTAQPGVDTPVVVDLVAIANCDVTVEATLVGNDGTAVSQPIAFAARVAPTIENVGTLVVGALLALGLFLGIIRTVRRGQSARRGAREAPETTAPLRVLGGEVPDHRPAPVIDRGANAGGEPPREPDAEVQASHDDGSEPGGA